MASRAFPVVLHASQVQFTPGGRLHFPRVESRMVLLCRAGTGTVRINGRTHPLEGGSVFVLPWGHSIAYAASEVDPFLVGGAHLVPSHEPDVPVRATIPHAPDHELAGCSWRRDEPGLGPRGVEVRTAADRPDLFDLTVYAIHVFDRGEPAVDTLRALGILLRDELRLPQAQMSADHRATLPGPLRRVLAYIDRRLEEPLTVAELAAVTGASQATLTRGFRAHLQTSPMRWVIRRRMDRATELLRTTDLPVTQVARRCGIADPYYFSRLFRDHLGESPSSWRRSRQLI